MAALLPVSFTQYVDKLVQVLASDGQDSLPVQQMLLQYARCKKASPNLDVRLYLPAGDVDDVGTFVLYIPNHRCNVVIHSLDKDIERVASQISSIADMDWKAGICLGPIHAKFDSMIELLMDKENLENWRPNPCVNLAMSCEEALKINPRIPEGFELQELTIEDAAFVNDRWPHKEHHTLAYIQDTLRIDNGLAIVHKETGERASWCLHSMVGGVGMIKTADEFRGRGLGEAVAAAMTKQIALAGDHPQVQIVTSLDTSKRLFARVGYQFTNYSRWFYLRRK